MVTQFPTQVQEHREYLEQEAGNIRNLMAERDYVIGKYYEDQGENRAASYYYAKVTDGFDGTQFASEAQSRIASLTDAPEEPVQRAAWLVGLFPEPRSTKPLIPAGTGTVYR